MTSLSANDLKVRGVAAIQTLLMKQPEAIISVRGKDTFVVMNIQHYHYLRECELDAALAQTKADLAQGNFLKETAKAHSARLDALAAKPVKPVKPVAQSPRSSRVSPKRKATAA